MADRQMRRVVFDTELDLMVILRDGVVFLDLNHERGNRPLAESVQGNFPEQNPRRGCRVLSFRCQCPRRTAFPQNVASTLDSILLNIVRLENLAIRSYIERQQLQ
ncbi:uncharacterized protein [Pocillopora verrucosa]|uniref:uncharacterized protein isoform X2 n=1 Tax=Pocillopora verrucosa TaxID=203993 RepID=UPI00333E62C9